MDKQLVILYGNFSDTANVKQQAMINGRVTCGYRPYADQIYYLCPQEYAICLSPENAFDVLSRFDYHTTTILALKHDQKGNRDEILSRLPHKKLYYSCCAYNTINEACTFSLVDTDARMQKNSMLWFKGKDPAIYHSIPENLKTFDYLLIGRRADKNELYFLQRLTEEVSQRRSVLWIGGSEHQSKIKTHHIVTTTGMMNMHDVAEHIPLARVGILFSEHPAEGFPQSFLEMTMAGVPVVYNHQAPMNHFYYRPGAPNAVMSMKFTLINDAETMLANRNPAACREFAIDNYSLQKSKEYLLSL
jgi:hypothetical protein